MRKFGIEIEACGMSPESISQLLNANGIHCTFEGSHNARANNAWLAKTDGSLDDYRNAFELVSYPMSGEEGLAEVKKVCDLLNEAGCDVNSKCGLHVHIDANDLSAQHIANVYNRYLANESQFDALMPNSRRDNNNRYCRSLRSEGQLHARSTAAETCRARSDRYYKVNLCSFAKFGTIEIRHHSGSCNGVKITNWVRLLLAFVEASRPQGSQTVVENVVERIPVAAQPVAEYVSIVRRLHLRGKQALMVQAIENAGRDGMSAAALATALESTVASVQSMVCRTNRGDTTHIQSRYNRHLGVRVYFVSRPSAGYVAPQFQTVTRQVTRVVEGGQLRSMWEGVPQNVVAYYARRRHSLAA